MHRVVPESKKSKVHRIESISGGQIRRHWWLFLGLFALLTIGCRSGSTPAFFETSAYEEYVRSLEDVELDHSEMGRSWLDAGRVALQAPATMTPPWREELFFSPDRPTALAWRLALRRGQALHVTMTQPAAASPSDRFFLELFAVEVEDGEEAVRRVTEAETSVLTHEIDEDGVFLLRLQPPLLVGGRVVLETTAGGQLTFPVEGRDERAIQSFYGDPRDGGARRHRGVDIFAPRGTAAVAAVDGLVTRVGENRLGGRVVWMRGDGKSFYYAHLDEQLVGFGSQVEAGEPVGRVGNTGNARTTPPHLHFGLFTGGSAVDPAPYLASPGTPPAVTANLDLLGARARVASRLARFRAGPSTDHAILDELPRDTPLYLEAAGADWYRARLVDGRDGYIAARLVDSAERPLRRWTVENDSFLLHRPEPSAAQIDRVASGESLDLLAEDEAYVLVRSDAGATGWLARE